MDEIAAVDTYLGTILRDYAPLAALFPVGQRWLYSREAPPDKAYPYTVFSFNSGVPNIAIGGGLRRLKQDMNYTILAITELGSLIIASNILQQIEAAINATPNLTVTIGPDDFYVSIARQINLINYMDNDAGKRVNYYGGVYQFFVTKTN